MTKSFNEYCKFLTEGRLDKQVEDDAFTFDVKESLDKISYINFKSKNHAIVELDEFKAIGKYVCNIYPNTSKNIAATLSLYPKDSKEVVTLMEVLIDTTNKTWDKNLVKFIKESENIVKKISDLGINR